MNTSNETIRGALEQARDRAARAIQSLRGAVGGVTGAGERASRSAAEEAYRMLRTNLGFATLEHKCHSILVTSPNPDEGKTVTAANLAIMLALAGDRVLLVDCDLRKPGIARLFDLNGDRGLTNALLGGHYPLDFAQQGPVEGLEILTSGATPPNPTELLGMQEVRDLWDRFKGSYDRVIIDSPPLLAVADALVLATQADGVILVVSAGQTRAEAALEARGLLEKANARILGVVMNKAVVSGQTRYYKYYRRVSEGEHVRL